LNKVVIIGRLTKDPELKYTPSGTAIANYTLAVDDGIDGATKEKKVNFINCIAFKNTAENLANYQKKGSKIAVFGKIQVRNYENAEGKRVYVTEVVAHEIEYLDSRSTNDAGGSNDPFSGPGKTIDITDDDLPF